MFEIESNHAGVVIRNGGAIVGSLRSGNVALIVYTFQNLKQQDPQRADDFIAGVMAGLNHCVMTNS